MQPKQARASRREAIMQHCCKLIDETWPVTSAERQAQIDRRFDELLAHTDQWVAFSNRETDLMSNEAEFIALADLAQREFRTVKPHHNEINAHAKAAIAQLIEEHAPRVTTNGIKIKLPSVTLSDEKGRSVTISDLWASLEMFADDGRIHWDFKVTAANEGKIPPHRTGYCHPHVQRGKPCMGSVALYYRNALNRGRFLDAFDMLSDALENYNSGSPYIHLDQFIGVTCPGCGVSRRSLLKATHYQADSPTTAYYCESCVRGCLGCGTYYTPDSAEEVITGICCVRCGVRCESCGSMHPKNAGCPDCSVTCPSCDRRLTKTHHWHVVEAGRGVDYRIRCQQCLSWYSSSVRMVAFDAEAAISRFGSWDNVLRRDQTRTIFLEAIDANLDRTAEQVG